MAGANDFTGKFISSTYQRVLQISGSGEITDGTGSLVDITTGTVFNAFTSSYYLDSASFDSRITSIGSRPPVESDPIFVAVSASFTPTESFNNFTASYNTGSFSGSFTGLVTSASYASFNPYIVTIGTRVYTDDTFITAGFKGYKHVGYDSNIIKTRAVANTNGNITIDVKRSGVKLGSLTLTNQSSSLDTTLSGWTTQLNTDDLLEFHVSQSSTYITDISIFIDIQARQ